jgi:hypothetical protein
MVLVLKFRYYFAERISTGRKRLVLVWKSRKLTPAAQKPVIRSAFDTEQAVQTCFPLEDNRIGFSQKNIIDNGKKTGGDIVHDTEAETTIF